MLLALKMQDNSAKRIPMSQFSTSSHTKYIHKQDNKQKHGGFTQYSVAR